MTNFSRVPSKYASKAITIDGANVTAPLECIYTFECRSYLGFQRFLSTTLLREKSGCNAIPSQSLSVQCEPEFWISPLWSDSGANFSTINQAMGDLSTAVTNWMRKTGSSQYVGQLGRKPGPATGIVISTTVCTEFDRYWLLLPIALLVASLVSLAMMVASSHRDRGQPVWKSSVLPLLFHGLVEPAQRARPLDGDELKALAKDLEVRFQNDVGPVGFENLEVPTVTAVPQQKAD